MWLQFRQGFRYSRQVHWQYPDNRRKRRRWRKICQKTKKWLVNDRRAKSATVCAKLCRRIDYGIEMIKSTVVVVFDFDRTIIHGDSDNWVVTQMGLTPLFNQLYSNVPWNSLMNRMMATLHSQGKTRSDIAECLVRTPLEPQIKLAIKAAHAAGCDLRIVSDANMFFIETILRYHGLLSCFTEIISNPADIDEQGMLRIFPYCTTDHGCNHCPPNMCKGLILDKIRAAVEKDGNNTFIYLGDGGGDYCPSLKLGNCDYVMPRKYFPLSERIKSNPTLIHAEVHEWEDAEELHCILANLIGKIKQKTAVDDKDCDLGNKPVPLVL